MSAGTTTSTSSAVSLFAPTKLVRLLSNLQYPAMGITGLLFLWWIGGLLIQNNENLSAFSAFAPAPAFQALYDLVTSGEIWAPITSSLYRILVGMTWGIAIGVPVGVTIGYIGVALKVANVPFQFLRMISPLAWMPIAVMAFETWDSAIIFLLVMATVWPIIFSTAHGVRRIDPNWFKVARNLGASGPQMLRRIILPAIMTDVMAGIRLAVGVAWVVLVPAEYLGVTSGLGYAINDARDTLSYDYLAAVVLVIGIIGYGLDSVCNLLIKRFNWHVE
ncbi:MULTISPECIES: ABC transporter permease [unclassified Marinobacter]|uniref:ABC transporter permease n=1 Tax=unclassified Marinobacter TaxID=83889 RepID=UPI0026E16DE3|nr:MULTISPECIES: ABC transporter permease [unclassified Marinobacter]MDO6441732.1 ABC transporter permease [Marinobacter sp. 2_MG-2023]MDO6824894.1 ABC transporter permease [Marinobacter sp. 1_MG-2023]